MSFKYIELFYCQNLFFAQWKHLLVLKFYKTRSQSWFDVYGFDHTSIISHEVFPNQTKNKIFLLSHQFLDHKKTFSKSPKRKYQSLMKQIIDCNKTNIQVDLIKKMNLLIKLWERSSKVLIPTNSYKKINNILYQGLWKWAKWRHSGKSSTWIKKRYWHFIDYCFLFSNLKS
jgi:hypothetical protein